MSQTIVPITIFKTGLNQYEQPETLPEDGFPDLEDILCFRNFLKKRDGWTSLINCEPISMVAAPGISQTTNPPGATVTTAAPHSLTVGMSVYITQVKDALGAVWPSTQPFRIKTVPTATTFTIDFDTSTLPLWTAGGVVQEVPFMNYAAISSIVLGATTTINTATPLALTTGQGVMLRDIVGVGGAIAINATTPWIVTVNSTTQFTIPLDSTLYTAYVDSGLVTQPIMGLDERITPGLFHDLIAFNPSQAFKFNNTDECFDNISGSTTWTGTDVNFFDSTNYAGSFWATNNFDPIRYYISGTTWTDFTPTLDAVPHTESFGPVLATAVTFGPFTVAHPPIEPGSITVTLSMGSTMALDEKFTDNSDGTLTGSNGSAGTVNYVSGAITLAPLVPDPTNDRPISVTYETSATSLGTALLMFPYKDRLVLLNTTEGGINYPQRARWSQNGTPYVTPPVPTGFSFQDDAWRSDINGKGDFLDAPTSEQIIGADFVRDTLVVQFENSSWRLRYTGNEAVLPFVWERIDSTYGCQCTFSVVRFDTGIMSVSGNGITLTTVNQTERIDYQIPDAVYSIQNTNNGQLRVYGIRDYEKQLVYWSFPDGADGSDPYFPNRVFVYNYLENNWSFYNIGFTCYGYYRRSEGLTWQDATMTWADANFLWASQFDQEESPVVVGGNQFGQVWFLDEVNTDNGAGFQFSVLTKKFNPFAQKGMQCKVHYLHLLVGGTSQGQITLNHFIDEQLNVPTESLTVPTSTSGQSKKWIRVPISGTAQYHQFQLTFSTGAPLYDPSDNQLATLGQYDADVEIYQIMLECSPAGRLNYGTS